MIPGYKGQFKGQGKKLGFQKRNQNINKMPIKITVSRNEMKDTSTFQSDLKRNVFRESGIGYNGNGEENIVDKKLLKSSQYEDIDFAEKFRKKLQKELRTKI